jgi:carbon storage regulator
MLVLMRKLGQSVIIGDDIEVKVVGIDRGQVKLGFTAPHEVPVHRREVYERIQEEKRYHEKVEGWRHA